MSEAENCTKVSCQKRFEKPKIHAYFTLLGRGADIFRKILVSVKFVSAILGPEMGAPILWTPGKMRSFCRKKRMSIGFLGFRGGGGILVLGGGGSADFIFMGARIFLTFPQLLHPTELRKNALLARDIPVSLMLDTS